MGSWWCRRDTILDNVEQLTDMRVADDYFYVMVRFTNELRSLQWLLLESIRSLLNFFFFNLLFSTPYPFFLRTPHKYN